MVALLFVLYVAVEIAALVAVAQWVGILGTVAIVLATSVLGFMLVRSQGKQALQNLRAAAREGGKQPGVALADGMLVTFGALLMFVPGLVTSALGALLLLPPTRALARPVLLAVAVRRYERRVAAGPRRGMVIDGEVVEVVEERFEGPGELR